jgi:Flp pilus assembly protein TadB
VSHLNDIDALMLQRKEENRKAEEEAKRKVEAEDKRKAAAEAKRKAEEEKKRLENMPKAKELYDEIGVSLKVLLLVTLCFAILPYARKSWVEVDKQGKVKRVIKTK